MNIFKKILKNKSKDCVCYYRNSKNTKQQYLRQDFICREYCINNNYAIKEIFSEVVSGNSTMENREAFINAITFCITHKIKTIIISEVDRFSRNIKTAKELIELLRAAKINLISVYENLSLDKNEEEMLNIVSFSNRELNVIYNRLQSGRRKAIEEGIIKLGRRKGSTQSKIQKEEKYKNVLEELREGNKIVNIATKTGVSISTIKRLKKEFKNELLPNK